MTRVVSWVLSLKKYYVHWKWKLYGLLRDLWGFIKPALRNKSHHVICVHVITGFWKITDHWHVPLYKTSQFNATSNELHRHKLEITIWFWPSMTIFYFVLNYLVIQVREHMLMRSWMSPSWAYSSAPLHNYQSSYHFRVKYYRVWNFKPKSPTCEIVHRAAAVTQLFLALTIYKLLSMCNVHAKNENKRALQYGWKGSYT